MESHAWGIVVTGASGGGGTAVGEPLTGLPDARTGRFMPPGLLPGQLDAPEPPGAGEDALVRQARGGPDATGTAAAALARAA